MTSDPTTLPVTELSRLILSRELSPVELVNAYLARISRLNGQVNAYITVMEEEALEQARRAEEALSRGEPVGKLHGIPMAVKDQLHARGVVTTGGSTILKEIAAEDSTVVARLREAGAILLGKLNLSEFALGGTLVHPFGTPRNPWNLDHQPGVSSSGSGIAVALSLCAAAIGEDTGGSVRIPAAWCGVTGLRPTWSRVSRYGMLGLSWSMDQAGPMTKTAEDCALVFQAIAGHDPKDPNTSREPVQEFRPDGSLKGVRVGVIREAMQGEPLDPEVKDAVERSVTIMEAAGADVSEASMPLFPDCGVISAAITDAEGAYVHRDLIREHADEYDVASRRRLQAASLVPAQLYQKAQRFRVLVRRQTMAALEHADVLIAPGSHGPAPKIETATGLDSKADVLRKFYGFRGPTGPFNLAAVPAVSVPCGFSSAGLPLAVQLAGRPFDEESLLRVAYAYQQRTDWHTRTPPLDA